MGILHWIVFYFYTLITPKLVPLGLFLFAIMLLLIVTSLAETNRSPFDFSEGESELVRGFNTEFGSVSFLLIFLAEYLSILFMSLLVRVLFNSTSIYDMYLFVLVWGLGFIWS